MTTFLADAAPQVAEYQPWLLGVLIVGAMALYVGQWISTESTSILLIALLALTGILNADEALSGFSNSATVTVGAMFVLSSGLLRTGALEFLALKLAEYSQGQPRRILLLLFLVVPPASAFVNNTPVVVMLLPVVLSICRQFDIKPSKLLIPLSFFSILGGTCTLLGTSTNILVSDRYREFAEQTQNAAIGAFAVRDGFELFDFTPLGLAYLVIGSAFLVFFSNRLLPDRSSLSVLLHPERKADFVTEVVIPGDSPLVGKKVSEAFEGSPVRMLELMKGEEILLEYAAREECLEPENSLIVEGTPQEINDFLGVSGTDLTSVIEDDARVPMRTFELVIAEAVILPDSNFEGLTVAELGLNRRFGVKVMAVQRKGRHHRYRIRAMRLNAGDVLLIQADATGLNALRESDGILVVEGIDRTLVRPKKAPVAISVLLGLVALAVANPWGIPLVIIALLAAVSLIVTRCIRADEASRSLDWSVLLLLAATIPLGVALEKTGLAAAIVDGIVMLVGGAHPVVFLSAFYLLTSLLSGVLSNNAVAVLLVPIAMSLAEQMDLNHEALLMAICFGASASFITPIGYQTNAIVMGPGGYTFKDYLKIGIPMNILMWITATIFIPLFWPLKLA
ncbi:MAG: SLC13 family permease [Planctomycetota bacterium]